MKHHRRESQFLRTTQEQALARQRNRCAACGETITTLGAAGKKQHRFGEGAQAHHVAHVKHGGTNAVDNCVVLCDSCHYSVHEGGNYRFGTVDGELEAYPYYMG
jgi:hypothetical protein